MDKYKILHTIKRKEIQNKIVSAVDIHREAIELVFTEIIRNLLPVLNSNFIILLWKYVSPFIHSLLCIYTQLFL